MAPAAAPTPTMLADGGAHPPLTARRPLLSPRLALDLARRLALPSATRLVTPLVGLVGTVGCAPLRALLLACLAFDGARLLTLAALRIRRRLRLRLTDAAERLLELLVARDLDPYPCACRRHASPPSASPSSSRASLSSSALAASSRSRSRLRSSTFVSWAK
ncbi:MAG: hypothetical protein H6720_23700 [Sandaracinus sp.]|nr:hypothetical protein [Sandaracinus sp.]